jgi:hypothetical protein
MLIAVMVVVSQVGVHGGVGAVLQERGRPTADGCGNWSAGHGLVI